MKSGIAGSRSYFVQVYELVERVSQLPISVDDAIIQYEPYLKLSFPSFMEVLYGNVLGVVIMTICLLVYVIAFEMGKKIVEIEV